MPLGLVVGYAVLDRPRGVKRLGVGGGSAAEGGGAVAEGSTGTGRLLSLAVMPGARGRGLGGALLRQALADAATLDHLAAVSLVWRVDNAAAQVRKPGCRDGVPRHPCMHIVPCTGRSSMSGWASVRTRRIIGYYALEPGGPADAWEMLLQLTHRCGPFPASS